MSNPKTVSMKSDTDDCSAALREQLHNSGVLAICVIGSPGCGKTTLIDSTIDRLSPDVRTGVITCECCSRCDAARVARHSAQVAHVAVDGEQQLHPAHISDALKNLNLSELDLLLIECSGKLSLRGAPNVGQDYTVTVFSIAAGDDKAEKHPDLVRAADIILLNKSDLRAYIPFDLRKFRDDVRRINPKAHVIEVSALQGTGMDNWVSWLRPFGNAGPANVSHWFG